MNAAVVSDSPAFAPRPSAYSRFDAKWLVIGGGVALVAWLSLLPLGFLLWQSFLTAHSVSSSARFTLQNYLDAYSGLETYRLFFNSLQFAFGAAAVSFVLGTFFAWINERTNTPCKVLFFALSIIPLIIPGILFTVSWILLASPKIGIVNSLLQGS